MSEETFFDTKNFRVGVVGAGSWGTALANLLAKNGCAVDLWVYEPDVCEQIRSDRENRVFLPGHKLSENIQPETDIRNVAAGKNLLLFVVPSHVMRETTEKFNPHIDPDTVIVSASKGIENKTHLTMTGVMTETLTRVKPENLSVLSGPSFAKEVVRSIPTAVTVAARKLAVARCVQEIFSSPCFRVYTSRDVIGVELGGAVKNIIAIAAGIVDGLQLGLNTRAALITRGLAEIRRLGACLGANPLTFSGLAGVGDLILTCTGDLSRNHTLGKQVGEGRTLAEILSDMRMVAEGVKTAKSVHHLSRGLGVEMPISDEIYHVLYDGASPRDAVYRLMTRNLKQELDDMETTETDPAQ